VARAFGTAKDALSVLRETALVLVIALLLLWPALMNSRLQAAGFTKANLGVFEWTAQVEASNQVTNEALQHVAMLQGELDSLEWRLDQLAGTVDDAAVRQYVEQLKTGVHASIQSVRFADEDLKSSRGQQEILLSRARRPAATTDSGHWAVVASGQNNLANALHEVRLAQKANYENVEVYDRNGWLRTVVEFPSERAARNTLSKMRQWRESAYVVDLDDWCPGRERGNTGVYTCPTNLRAH